MVARARATRPHASPPARDGASPRRCLFWETPRARERFAMETAEKQTSRVPPGFSPSIGPARVERASLPDPVARARVRDDAPDGCLTRRSKCESVSLHHWRDARVGSRPFIKIITGLGGFSKSGVAPVARGKGVAGRARGAGGGDMSHV